MSDQIIINGVDAETGQYLVQPMDFGQAVAIVKGEEEDSGLLRFLGRIWAKISQPHLGLPFDLDPADVTQAGWGLVFHSDEEDSVRQALQPLYEHRRRQIGNDAIVKILSYRDGEGSKDRTRAGWLARHGVGTGTVEPTKVPFYLLLVGSPERIPFVWSQELDVEYAVGRLHFDTADEYSAYVESLIAYETADAIPNAKEAVFFAPRHDFDKATQMSADLLVNPLFHGQPQQGAQPAKPPVAERFGFEARKIWGDDATKAALQAVFASESGKPPAYLFTASHGLGWSKPHADQPAYQGALVCQDWSGLGGINKDWCLAGRDVSAEARVHGMVSFHFACFGAGTPSHDRFLHKKGQPPPQIAKESFFSALPKTLLTHPKGGALACVGHVERAWGCSIVTAGAGPQIGPFRQAIGRTLTGQPIGLSIKDFNERFAALSTSLASMLENISFGAKVDDHELASSWIARNDAQGYVVMGDPAARIRIDKL